jgi:alkanesulfonate monooxygenase SsuD/methylene tetrahydromethanopterin reductase-like flavin-dependent oxidoreductase (luciferase family)
MPPGYVSEATARMKMKSQVQAAADRSQIMGSLSNDIEGILKEGYVLIGSPDEVADQLRKIAKKFNVGNLLTLLQFGNMDKELTNYNTKLFAERVLPQIKDLFEDEWEHRWWPTPMQQNQRAEPRTLMAAE